MIMIGSDHGGVELKERLVDFVRAQKRTIEDVGTLGTQSVDYPDYGQVVARQVALGLAERGILICTNGIGMSILANKFPGVRAALVADVVGARMSREHLDANILIMGGGFIGKFLACEIVKVWLNTPFAGGRHQRRLNKIAAIEDALGLGDWVAKAKPERAAPSISKGAPALSPGSEAPVGTRPRRLTGRRQPVGAAGGATRETPHPE